MTAIIKCFPSGNNIDLINPDPALIDVRDIAHALSNICRYGGHTPTHYSVAEHSIRCAMRFDNHPLQLTALMHDAAEAYVGDMISPIKKLMPMFEQIELQLLQFIAHKYGLQYPFPPIIHEIDMSIRETEKDLITKDMLWPIKPKEAEQRFLTLFYRLHNKLKV